MPKLNYTGFQESAFLAGVPEKIVKQLSREWPENIAKVLYEVGYEPGRELVELSNLIETMRPAAPVKKKAPMMGRKNRVPTSELELLAPVVVDRIIKPADLPLEEQKRLAQEIEWLFGAAQHSLQIMQFTRRKITRETPVPIPIPQNIKKIDEANNLVLSHLTKKDLATLCDEIKTVMARIKLFVDNLNACLKENESMDIQEKNTVKTQKVGIVQNIQYLAEVIRHIYGVEMTDLCQIPELINQLV